MRIFELIEQAEQRLDAEVLLAHALGIDRLQLLTSKKETVSQTTIDVFFSYMERRNQGEPVAYITGKKEFFGRDFYVSNAVLIPRPDTETVVEKALGFLSSTQSASIIDVCTGSGCIGITLAIERPLAKVVATDISSDALEIASQNIELHHLVDRVQLLQGDLLEPCLAMRNVDMIVANPPYIHEREMADLMRDVRDFEPHLALQGRGEEGLFHHAKILEQASPLLKQNGVVIFEIGFNQGEAIQKIPHSGFRLLTIFLDIANNVRGAIFIKL